MNGLHAQLSAGRRSSIGSSGGHCNAQVHQAPRAGARRRPRPGRQRRRARVLDRRRLRHGLRRRGRRAGSSRREPDDRSSCQRREPQVPANRYAAPAMARPIRAPELSELETLTVCAAEGSLAAAAAQLGISRPAVAKRVAALEAIAGAALLRRDTRGVQLTEHGVTLVAHARRLLAERDALMEAIAALRDDGGASRISGVRSLLGRPAAEAGTWYSLDDRRRLLEQVRLHGVVRDVEVRAQRPDGTARSGHATSQLVQLGGRPRLLTTIVL